MATVSPWTKDTFDTLYSIFKRDFKDTQPKYKGHTVWFFPEIEDGKEVIFWHLTHREDRETGKRLPDPRRCERLSWVKSILENPDKRERLLVNSEFGWGGEGYFSVPRSVLAMRRMGLKRDEIEQVTWENPKKFFKLEIV